MKYSQEDKSRMQIEHRSVGDLIPYALNSRTHSEAQVTQIAASIREFGFTNPILIDEQGGIIAGHGRLMAAKKLGMDEVPTITLSGLTTAQKKAYVIADNKLALNAGWDNEMLALELGEIGDLGFDLDLTGFSAGEIAGLTFEEKDLYPDSSTKEIDPDDYNMGHQCPKCGFEFDDDK
jgi:ParB-like chromosome segregation protein Spo0J